jgi:hypothetical protein
MNTKEIREMLSQYTYGQYNIPTSNINVEISRQDREAKIHNFYSSERSTTGSCHELAWHAHSELKNRFPDMHFLGASGSEPQYFNAEKARHVYILGFGQKIERLRQNRIDDKIIIKEYEEKNPLVIDPSLKVVEDFQCAKYTIRALQERRAEDSSGNAAYLSDGAGALPLGIVENILISCYVNFEHEDIIDYAITDSQTDKLWSIKDVGVSTHELTEGHPRLRRTIKILDVAFAKARQAM